MEGEAAVRRKTTTEQSDVSISSYCKEPGAHTARNQSLWASRGLVREEERLTSDIAAGEEDDDQERFPFDLVAKKELEDRYEIVAAWSLPKANLLSMKGKTGVILDQWEQQRHGARLLHRKTTFPSDPTTKQAHAMLRGIERKTHPRARPLIHGYFYVENIYIDDAYEQSRKQKVYFAFGEVIVK
uniref:Uncharacterized protein n=1 Tax=Oryza sativa subsp. indica TaxID=39946 RepID=A0A679BAP6_ORYSI|nr:hypothetical protein [Oryza sativa Indica Group]BBD82409.1 hypothetical protein [Oryza sativa Indica Group]